MWLKPPSPQYQPLHRPATHVSACCDRLQLLKPVQNTATLCLCRYMCDELLDQEVMRGLFQERLDGEASPKGPAPKEPATNKRKQKVRTLGNEAGTAMM